MSQRDRITSLPDANLTGVLLTVYPEDRLLQHLAVAHLEARLQYEAFKAVQGLDSPEARKTSKVMELIEKELADRAEGILQGMNTQIEAHQAELAHLDKANQSEVLRASELRTYSLKERDVKNARIMLDVLTRKLAQEIFDTVMPRQPFGTNAVPMP